MIANLDEESMDVVLHGDPAADQDRSGGSAQDNIPRSHGVIGCWLMMMPEIDLKREYAANKNSKASSRRSRRRHPPDLELYVETQQRDSMFPTPSKYH